MKFLPLIALLAATLGTPLWETPARAQSAGMAVASPYLATASTAVTEATPEAMDEQTNTPLITIRKRVDEVSVVFTATNSHGKFVKNLSQNDFSVLDNQKPAQSILDFRGATDLPLRVGLVIDSSGSVSARMGFEQESAIQFLNQVLRPRTDKAFVIGFNSHSVLMQDYTDNVLHLSEAVHRLHDGGGTALYDAVYLACREKLLKSSDAQPVRRALIVVSDGEDNQSEERLADAIQMAQRAEVVIYAISTDDSGVIMRGDNTLEQLATATGGRAFFPYKMSDITRAFSAIQEELRSQYSVAYKPAEFSPDGRYHSIEIVANNKKIRVRARPGYYAPRQ